MMFIVFRFSILFVPYILLITQFLYEFIPFDKNPFLILLVTLYFLIWIYLSEKDILRIIFFALFLIFFCEILLLRSVFNVSFSSIFPLRAAILMLIFVDLPKILTTQGRIKQIKIIIMINTVIQAIAGIVHYYFLPFIITGKDEFVSRVKLFEVDFVNPIYYSRESGILGNANIYANFILLGLFLHCTAKMTGVKLIYQLILIALLLWGILLSGSRLPVIFAFIIIILFLLKNFSIFELLCLSAPMCLASVFIIPNVGYIISRFSSEGNSIRNEKLFVAIKTLLQDPLNLFIGAPPKQIAEATSASGYTFSDNSYLYFFLIYGVFFTVFWGFYFLFLCNKNFRFSKAPFFWIYFTCVLWFTNSVLWDIWLVYAFVTIAIISKNDDRQTWSCIEKNNFKKQNKPSSKPIINKVMDSYSKSSL